MTQGNGFLSVFVLRSLIHTESLFRSNFLSLDYYLANNCEDHVERLIDWIDSKIL